MIDNDPVDNQQSRKGDGISPGYLSDVLKYAVEISALLRLQQDVNTLLTQVVAVACRALRFHCMTIYLADDIGFFHAVAVHGMNAGEELYLRHHPLPTGAIARLTSQSYRFGESYFIPAEVAIWQDKSLASYFARGNSPLEKSMPLSLSKRTSADSSTWNVEDLLLVPLIGAEDRLLGFLKPDAPLDGLRPTRAMAGVFAQFAQQVAVVIECARCCEELHESVRQAKEAERMKNAFLLTASHELRTPLTAVQGYLELLGDYGTTLDERARARFIRNARRGCDELVLLLGNVLDATHLDVEKLFFKTGPLYLVQSAQLILEILEPIITREHRTVEVCIAEDLRVWADELRLRQILLNLLGNALKYTPAGSRIALTAESVNKRQVAELFAERPEGLSCADLKAGTFVVLALRDWGPGISPDEQALLFTKFTRLESARNSMQRGAGLGLYLCRQLTEAMGGRIWMESSGVSGEGVAFFVALPSHRV